MFLCTKWLDDGYFNEARLEMLPERSDRNKLRNTRKVYWSMMTEIAVPL